MNLTVNQINYGLIKEKNFTINLNNNNFLVYFTHNEGKSVISERLKSIKKWQLMIANLILVI